MTYKQDSKFFVADHREIRLLIYCSVCVPCQLPLIKIYSSITQFPCKNTAFSSKSVLNLAASNYMYTLVKPDLLLHTVRQVS